MKEKIINGNVYLGIELGSTRIKACLTDDTCRPIAAGSYSWENKFENGFWTYSQNEIKEGVRECYAALCGNVYEKYGVKLKKLGAIGISAMMHGYLVFDENDKLLVPFRTWRNTTAERAADILTEELNCAIPIRWSISHLYQAILDNEVHVPNIRHITTLAGYVHYLLTGNWEVGVCEASGIFPVDGYDYDVRRMMKFSELIKEKQYPWDISEILPRVKTCMNDSTVLSDKGAEFLDKSGELLPGITVCAPEGDAATGMVATNSLRPGTCNISAGTSVFAMLILERPLRGIYKPVNILSAPSGENVALVHSNNGCSELDLWVNMFGEFAGMLGKDIDKSELYEMLYINAMSGDEDCGDVISYNYLVKEPVAGVENAKPLIFRTSGSSMTLANFFRSQLCATLSVLKMGMDILTENERVSIKSVNAHGGLFKVKGTAQKLLANALKTNISVSETAGEGGAWGMALLAAYSKKNNGELLSDWLERNVFADMTTEVAEPDRAGADGFDKYFEEYKKGIKLFG